MAKSKKKLCNTAVLRTVTIAATKHFHTTETVPSILSLKRIRCTDNSNANCMHFREALCLCEFFDLKMAGDAYLRLILFLCRFAQVVRCILLVFVHSIRNAFLQIFPFVCSAPYVNHSFYLHLIRLSIRFVALNRLYHIFFLILFFLFFAVAALTFD